TATQPSAHWISLLEEAGIPCGPINTVDQVFADPQVQHLRMAQPVTHPRLGEQHMVGTAINMAGVEEGIRLPTPSHGQHTAEVLASLGYDEAAIAALREKGVV
ncbi:MAG: CoA transferase, partial [Roseomonas sp.]|nr:CoA transferase [Roseomonas sp.]